LPQVIFHESSCPSHLKFVEIFTSQGAPPVSTTLAVNFATGTVGVVDTGGTFSTGVNDTGSK
jgi:hypothetical protein